MTSRTSVHGTSSGPCGGPPRVISTGRRSGTVSTRPCEPRTSDVSSGITSGRLTAPSVDQCPKATGVPAVRVEGPIDITGAGDTVSAAAVLALAAGATLPEAALVGALAASLAIQQLAVTGAARPEELPARLELWRAQQMEGGRS